MPAPYSDNLYSAGDASDDDHDDALSPTDGYFHASTSSDAASSSHHRRASSNVPLVPNVLVEDPSLPDGSKAREAEEERRLNSDAHSPQVTSPPRGAPSQQQQQQQQQQPYHRRSVEEEVPAHHHAGLSPSSPLTRNPVNVRTPLFLPPQQADAPPAYTPSPSSPPSAYQTFPPSAPTMGLPEEQQRLLPRGPESMGGTPPYQDSPSLWQRFKDSLSGHNPRKKIKTALGVLVIFSIVFMLFSSFTLRPTHKDPDIGGIGDDEPVKDPNMDHGDLAWKPPKGCLDTPHRFSKRTSIVDFHSDRNITVIEQIEKKNEHNSGWVPHVTGELILSPTTGGSPGSIDVEVISNHEDLGVELQFDKESQLLRIITPRKVAWESSEKAPCIQIRVTVWAPQQTWLDFLRLNLTHLDVEIRDGLILGTVNYSAISTVIGNVKTSVPRDGSGVVPYILGSRDIRIETVSGDVKGWYPLYDTLSVRTVSGDVAADVTTKPVDTEKPRPAILSVNTVSGGISIHEPIDRAIASTKPDKEFPPRDYIVRIGSASGDVTADVAVSTLAKFGSQSGDFKLRLWPVLDSGLLKSSASKPFLSTETKSGDTKVELLEPVWTSVMTGEPGPEAPKTPATPGQRGEYEDIDVPVDHKDPWLIIHPHGASEEVSVESMSFDTPALSVLKSKHSSVSGDIKLIYPSSWEGHLSAETISGSQTIRGEGLELSRTGGPFMRRVTGKKGHGYSDLNIQSMSGDEDVVVGKVSE